MSSLHDEAIASLTPEQRTLRQRAEGDFYFFTKGILGYDFLEPHVHGPVCSFITDKESHFKQICLPRGFLKTTVCTIAHSIWLAAQLPDTKAFNEGPDVRVLVVSNTKPNAQKMVHAIRMHFERNELLKMLFPELIHSSFNATGIRWSDECAELPRARMDFAEGTYEPAGIGTAITSRHFTRIKEDDLIFAKKDTLTEHELAPTQEDIEKAINFHKLNLPILVNPMQNYVDNIGTRWAPYDLIHHIQEHEAHRYNTYEIAATEDGTPEGPPVYPERFSKEILDDLRDAQGPYIFATQYLNQPIDPSRIVFHREDFQFFEGKPSVPLNKVVLVDPAISEKRQACDTAILCLGFSEEREIYCLDCFLGKIPVTEIINRTIRMALQNDCWRIGVETIAFQAALAQLLKERIFDQRLAMKVDEIKHGNQETKDSRIQGLQPFSQRRAIFLRSGGAQDSLLRQFLDFPVGKSRDGVDAFSFIRQYVRYPTAPRPQEKKPDGILLDDLLDELRKRNHTFHGYPYKNPLRSVS